MDDKLGGGAGPLVQYSTQDQTADLLPRFAVTNKPKTIAQAHGRIR